MDARRFFLLLAGVASLLCFAADAQAQRAREKPKYDMSGQPYKGGDMSGFGRHDDGHRRTYDYDFHPNTRPSNNSSSHGGSWHGGGGHHHHHHGRPYPVPYPVYPYSSFWYSSGSPWWWNGGYDYGYYYNGPVVLPPVTIPANSLFGPQPVQQLMGVDAVLNAHRQGRQEVLDAPQPDLILRGGAPAGEVRDRREVNAAGIARAERFVGFGDANFAKQQFHSALQRYKEAVEAAPTFAEAYFRQGHAQVALRRYDLAARAYRQGLQLDPDWPRSNFDLNALYGDNRAALIASRERLAEAASADPNNADLVFLLGVQMYFAGERDRSQLFFRRAKELAVDPAPIDLFLTQPAVPAPSGPRAF